MNGPIERTIRKFNPGTFQPDEEVIRQFVVRKCELDIVLEILRGNIDSPSCEHVLLVAPRGRGKTTLLARVASELRTDTELSGRLFPIRFMEESQEIFNLADFWLETLFYLARESTERDPDLSRELQDTHADLAGEWRGENLEERARAAVLEAADRIGMKLVLMVENLQALCECVDDDFGWKLRGTLQSEPQIMLLATATSRFKGLDDAREPFFELFRVLRLESLDTDQCRCLWQMVTRDAVTGREIRPLQILTGGNPRLLIIIADFARHRSLRELMEDLVSLIDDHTEYFRAHLEGFAKTERRVYLAVIDLWQPSTTGEIAARARMDVRAVSALLGRLVERGAVTVEGSGRKRMYAASERLYSIYYKLRRERDEAAVVRNLIHFMGVFYSEVELDEWSRALTFEAMQWPTIRKGIEQAVTETPGLRQFFSSGALLGTEHISSQTIDLGDEMFEGILDEIQTEGAQGRFDKVIEIANKFLAPWNSVSDQVPVFSVFLISLAKVTAHWELGEIKAMIPVCNELIERFGDHDAPMLQQGVAKVLTYRGYGYGRLGEARSEIATWDELLERFAGSDDPNLQVAVARTLVSKGYRHGDLGESDAEIAAYEEAIGHFGYSDTPEIRMLVAIAMLNKGYRQGELGHIEAMFATCEEAVERFGDSNDPMVQSHVASAMALKGHRLGKLGRFSEAVAAYEEVVEHFGDSKVPELQRQVIAAFVNKGHQQEHLGKIEEVIATLKTAVDRFRESNDPGVQDEVAEAWVNLGAAHGRHGDAETASAVSDEVIERFGDADSPVLQEAVARALRNKAVACSRLGKAEAEIAVYDRLIGRFGDSDVPELQVQVAWALTDRVNVQIQMGHLEQAADTCDVLDQRFGRLDDGDRIAFGWRAKGVKAKILFAQDNHPTAMETLHAVYAAFDPSNGKMMRAFLRLLIELIATGISEPEVVEILSSDREKSRTMEPFGIALRIRTGRHVRAPVEVIEVAKDLLDQIVIEEKAVDWTISSTTTA